MFHSIKSKIYLLVGLAVILTGFFISFNRQPIREHKLRVSLKNLGCDRAGRAGLLPENAKAGEDFCRTIIFSHRNYNVDDPLKVEYLGKKIEFPSEEIFMIEINPKDDSE